MEIVPMLLLFGLLGVMMYFMTRRQRKAQQQQQTLQNSIEVGDRVMTTSGLYGTVTDAEDPTTISIEIAPGVETEWLRVAVREKVGPVEEIEDEIEDLEDDSDEVAETVDPETNEPVVVAKDVELESGKQK
jgi:preprotein translocase subunit YajC